MFDEFIDEFMFSHDMREYLKSVSLNPLYIPDMVYFSPVPIQQKLEAMYRIRDIADNNDYPNMLKEIEKCIWNLEEALRIIETDGVFAVEELYFDMSECDSSASFEQICGSVADVIAFAEGNVALYDPDDIVWHEAGKWIKTDDGKYQHFCDYVIATGEIVYSELNDRVYHHQKVINFYSSVNLNLPVPFQPGDILSLDGRPFGPKEHILIVGIGDNRDCCCLQGLSRNEKGLWTVGAVKHGMIGYDYHPKISPLYSAVIYDGKLDDKDKMLAYIRDRIKQDGEWANYFHDELSWEGVTDDELIVFIEKRKEK